MERGENPSESLEEPLLGAADSTPTSQDVQTDSSPHVSPELPESLRNPWKNHNVRLSLLLCVLAGIADSIWTSVILSGFLFALARAMGRESAQNTLVGAAEAVEGLTQLFIALPVGYMADVWGKAKVVRLGGVLMIVAIVITLGALVVVHREAEESPKAATQSYYVMVGALALWGIVNGISFGPSQALFSDSIPKGQRSDLLTWLYTCYLLSSTVGPIVGIILLLTVSKSSEDWSLDEIYPVFFIGVCLEIPAAIIMFFFSEKHVIPEEESEETHNDEQQNSRTDEVDDEPNEDERDESTRSCSLGKRSIPYVLFISSLIVSLGSGASVKYFPLFFKELGLSNAAVQGIFLAVSVSISSLSFLGTATSKKLGRIETTVLFDVIGTCLLYYMTWLSRDIQHGDNRRIGLIVVVCKLLDHIVNSFVVFEGFDLTPPKTFFAQES